MASYFAASLANRAPSAPQCRRRARQAAALRASPVSCSTADLTALSEDVRRQSSCALAATYASRAVRACSFCGLAGIWISMPVVALRPPDQVLHAHWGRRASSATSTSASASVCPVCEWNPPSGASDLVEQAGAADHVDAGLESSPTAARAGTAAGCGQIENSAAGQHRNDQDHAAGLLAGLHSQEVGSWEWGGGVVEMRSWRNGVRRLSSPTPQLPTPHYFVSAFSASITFEMAVRANQIFTLLLSSTFTSTRCSSAGRRPEDAADGLDAVAALEVASAFPAGPFSSAFLPFVAEQHR